MLLGSATTSDGNNVGGLRAAVARNELPRTFDHRVVDQAVCKKGGP